MTQIALIGDLHGNVPAVRALERDLQRRKIDKIFCLGDSVGKGPDSDQTFDWVNAHCTVSLRGNWDEGIALKQFAGDKFYYEQLGKERMEILRRLPLEHHMTLSGRKIRMFHGRPVMENLLFIESEQEQLRPFFDPNFDVVIYADVHAQGLRVVKGKGLLCNIGSVGNAIGINKVEYAILSGEEADENAPLDITLVTLPYDFRQAAQDAKNQPDLPNREMYEYEVLTGIYTRKMLPSEVHKLLMEEYKR